MGDVTSQLHAMAENLAAENARTLLALIAEAEEYLRHRPPVEPDTPEKAEYYWATHPELRIPGGPTA